MAKLRSLWWVYFVLPTLFVFTLAFYRAVLYGNVAFSFLVLSTKKRYSRFLKKEFAFQKICFIVNVLKTFKISSDCHIKKCKSLKRSTILKIPSALIVVFKRKPLKKNNSHFAVNLAEILKEATIHFYLMDQ